MRIFKIAMVICVSVICFASLILMSACSEVERYDADEIAAVVKSYYNDKYGINEDVTVVHQELSYSGLFGPRSTGEYYCTMTDGQSVKYDRDASSCKDNRQQTEITKEMCKDILKSLRTFESGLDDAGYTWSWDGIDGTSTEERAYRIAENIAHVYFDTSNSNGSWVGTTKDSEDADFQTAYFATRYDGNLDEFLSREFSGDCAGFFPVSTLSLDGGDIPDTTVFDCSQSPKWHDLADEFFSAYAKRYNGSGIIYFENAGILDVPREYARLGTCSLEKEGLSWNLIKWEKVGDGIWLTPKGYDEGDIDITLELVEVSDFDLEKYQRMGAISASEDIAGAKVMEVVAHGATSGYDVKWASARVGYDPTKYEIKSVQREALEEFEQNKFGTSNSNANGNKKLEPVYVRHADVGGGYGLLDMTAYEKAGTDKATILIVKNIG